MSEVKKGNGLVYKNHPLRRIDNLIARHLYAMAI